MSTTILIYIIILFVLGVTTQDVFVVSLMYILGGALLLGRWWSRYALKKVSIERDYPQHIFLGETIQLKIRISNQARLPVVWLRLQESLPTELSSGPFFHQVLSLAPREKFSVTYTLTGRKRGYYNIGPLQLSSGDVLGLEQEHMAETQKDHIIVYPQVLPLPKLGLPSHSPMGSLRHHLHVYEDPSRPSGKREYTSGDSLRRIDWKASAAVGRLQVKLYEPSVELETAIFLNLNAHEYHYRSYYDATELAIVVAASIANWNSKRKQAVGLFTNGTDPLNGNAACQPISPRKGRGHLIRILETLARVKALETTSLTDLIYQQRVNLSWGSTLVIISGQADQVLFNEMFRAQRSGMDIVLILCGSVTGVQGIRQQCRHFNIPFYSFWKETDLDIWRK